MGSKPSPRNKGCSSTSSSAAGLSSIEKKRLRDRRAQQNMRDRQTQLIASLTQQIEHCRQVHLDGSDMQKLQDDYRSVQRENVSLRQKLEELRRTIDSCLTRDVSSTPFSTPGASLYNGNDDDNSSENGVARSSHSSSAGRVEPTTHIRTDTCPIHPSSFEPLSVPSDSHRQSPHNQQRAQIFPVKDQSFSPCSESFGEGRGASDHAVPGISIGSILDGQYNSAPGALPKAADEASTFRMWPGGQSSIIDPDLLVDDRGDSLRASWALITNLDTQPDLGATNDRQAANLSRLWQECYSDPLRQLNCTEARVEEPTTAFSANTSWIWGTNGPALSRDANVNDSFVPAKSAREQGSCAMLDHRRRADFMPKPNTPAIIGASFLGPDYSSIPAWSLTPCLVEGVCTQTLRYAPWSTQEEMIRSAPDVMSPLEIFSDAPQDQFTAYIQHSLRKWQLRPPEMLAISWLIYSYCKWQVQPSPLRYNRLPPYFRPTVEQLSIPHPPLLDIFLWERLRTNLIRYQNEYDLDDVIKLFSRCLKVRWPGGKEILCRGENSGLQIRSDFLKTFMSTEGWGLAPDFVEAYPHLLHGIDVASIIYRAA